MRIIPYQCLEIITQLLLIMSLPEIPQKSSSPETISAQKRKMLRRNAP